MADRVLKVKECDRLSCRRRRGVEAIELVISYDGCGPEGEPVVWRGELCPMHLGNLLTYIRGMFRNTKEYPSDE